MVGSNLFTSPAYNAPGDPYLAYYNIPGESHPYLKSKLKILMTCLAYGTLMTATSAFLSYIGACMLSDKHHYQYNANNAAGSAALGGFLLSIIYAPLLTYFNILSNRSGHPNLYTLAMMTFLLFSSNNILGATLGSLMLDGSHVANNTKAAAAGWGAGLFLGSVTVTMEKMYQSSINFNR